MCHMTQVRSLLYVMCQDRISQRVAGVKLLEVCAYRLFG